MQFTTDALNRHPGDILELSDFAWSDGEFLQRDTEMYRASPKRYDEVPVCSYAGSLFSANDAIAYKGEH